MFAFPEEFGVRQAEAGHRPIAGADQQQLDSPLPARMPGAVAVPDPPYRSERFAVMTEWPHGTGVASISRSSSALHGVASASHRSADIIRAEAYGRVPARIVRKPSFETWRDRTLFLRNLHLKG